MGRLEQEIEQAIAAAVTRLGLKERPHRPSSQAVRMMAKAAVSVYEAVADECRAEGGES